MANMTEEILRCWVCKRTEEEVKAWLEDHDEDIERLKRRRSDWDTDNWESNTQRVSGLIQLASSEWTEAHIPLCIICQGMLLFQGAIVAHRVIDDKLADRELMEYTEYEIVPKKKGIPL